MRTLLSFAALVFLVTASAVAQDSSWQNLKQIKPGTKVKVVESNLKTLEGKFVGFSETDLTIAISKREEVIPKEQVYRVTSTGRGRNALIGAIVGGAAGIAIGAAIMEREKGYGGAVAGTGVGFGAIGAGIGAAIPHTTTYYRAEKPRK